MNRKELLLSTICITTLALAGCSGSNDNGLYNSLDKQVTHNTAYISDDDQVGADHDIEAAINGNEKEYIVKLIANANVMNKPSKDANVVGSVKANESVLVIGNESINGWYKIAYNGRVCYIERTKMDMSGLKTDNGDGGNEADTGENNKPTTTTRPQRPISTSDKTTTTNNSTSGESDTTTTGIGGETDTTTGSNGETETTTTGNGGETGTTTGNSFEPDTTTGSNWEPDTSTTGSSFEPNTTTGSNWESDTSTTGNMWETETTTSSLEPETTTTGSSLEPDTTTGSSFEPDTTPVSGEDTDYSTDDDISTGSEEETTPSGEGVF